MTIIFVDTRLIPKSLSHIDGPLTTLTRKRTRYANITHNKISILPHYPAYNAFLFLRFNNLIFQFSL